MSGHGRYELLGQTLDDAAGEAFDKVARLLGLGYPGGPVIDRLAAQGNPTAIRFPRPMLADGLNFSFSGLKTAVAVHLRRNPDANPADVAASFQRAVTDVLETKALRAARIHGVTSVCLAGGVAANSELRRRFEALDMEVFLPSRAMCTDNAAMVAAAGWHQLHRLGPSPLDTAPAAKLDHPHELTPPARADGDREGLRRDIFAVLSCWRVVVQNLRCCKRLERYPPGPVGAGFSFSGNSAGSALARMSATTSCTSPRIPASAAAGVAANQLSDGNSRQSPTCSPFSGDQVTRKA